MLRQWGPALGLLLLALVSAWLTKHLALDREPMDMETSRVPDVYMEDFITTTMDETGQPRRRLTAANMTHYPDTNTNELESPLLVMYRPPKEPWHVKSERGWVSANRQVILLLGNVTIWRNDRNGVKALEILTRDLRVLPDSDYGETDKLAVIINPTSESRGVGMRTYLEQGRLELLSQVETVYEKTEQ